MMRIFILIIAGFLIMGCDGEVEGVVVDNFNNPVENVRIKISNSGYRAISNKKGEFDIEYTPGKFNVEFNKVGYVTVVKTLEIADETTHSMGNVVLTKFPDAQGLYFQKDNRYHPLSTMELIESNPKYDDGVDSYHISFNRKALNEVNIRDSIITLYSYQIPDLVILENNDNISLTVFERLLKMRLECNRVDYERIDHGEELIQMTFNFNYENTYSLIRIPVDSFGREQYPQEPFYGMKFIQ